MAGSAHPKPVLLENVLYSMEQHKALAVQSDKLCYAQGSSAAMVYWTYKIQSKKINLFF